MKLYNTGNRKCSALEYVISHGVTQQAYHTRRLPHSSIQKYLGIKWKREVPLWFLDMSILWFAVSSAGLIALHQVSPSKKTEDESITSAAEGALMCHYLVFL